MLSVSALNAVSDFEFTGDVARDTGVLCALLRREGARAYPARRGIVVLYVPNGRTYIDARGVERESRDERYLALEEVVAMAREAIARVEAAHEEALEADLRRDLLAEMGIGE